MAKVVKVKVLAANDGARALPGDLQHVARERNTGDTREHEVVRLGTRESTEVVANSLNKEIWYGNRAAPGNRLRLLNQRFPMHRDRPTLFDA